MACRKYLIGLERRGEIVLPVARCRPPERRPAEACPAAPPVSGRLADLAAITLRRVGGGTPESRIWDAMMVAHHPCRRASLCGGQIRYLVCGARHGVLGDLAASGAAWRLREPYLERDEIEQLFASLPRDGRLATRDKALLLFLYNTGARAAEVVGPTVGQLVLAPPPRVNLHGKGDKWRSGEIGEKQL
jgi:integrase